MADEKNTASKGITVKIVTPEGDMYSQDGVELAILNTQGGQVGVMANHVPVLAALSISELVIKKDGRYLPLAVNDGIAEFSNSVLTVIADSAETSDKIDVSRAKSAKERAEARLAHAQEIKNQHEIVLARVALMRAVNRIQVASVNSGR
ncbi:F0F1 ATP synthase subunit epsilon [Convivina intestini]|uniref:F0F1 ATP synthase subunit epsilon n=1 Tax=Convivina intestini TaxID=1505726 RepID=UPI00200C5941|nr:F0F1 ATP synthase subunit epsilon [Convivina intestini]CAH1853462.1 ATP synthase epsilon chain [Convivina intestini]